MIFFNHCFKSTCSGMCKDLKAAKGPATSHRPIASYSPTSGWDLGARPQGAWPGVRGGVPGSFLVLVILKAKRSQFQRLVVHLISYSVSCALGCPGEFCKNMYEFHPYFALIRL